MPKFAMDIDGTDVEAFEGNAVWDGPIPETGYYTGFVKIASLDISTGSKSAGKTMIKVGVELKSDEEDKKQYNGYIAWRNLVLMESTRGYINQWLKSMTDGTEKEFAEIKSEFYAGFDTDDEQKHITDIGPWNVNSPEGRIPVKIVIKKEPYKNPETNVTVYRSGIDSFLAPGDDAKSVVRGKSSASSDKPAPPPARETSTVDLDDEDEDEVDNILTN